MAYHIYTRSSGGAVGNVGTAREALAKAAEFVEDGHADVIIKTFSETSWTPRR
jgi:hypothetical protein